MKNTLIFLIVFSIGLCAKAQTNIEETPYSLPNIVPAAPDVHNFQKYGDVPVGYYTGIPQINIPLYEITTRTGVSVPISLKYHAGGIKVDEKASRTGLGWSLQAEGMISRTVSGLLDFTGTFTKPNLNTFNPNDSANNYNDYLYANSVIKGESDSQPDIYSYTFLNTSGKFVFDKDKNLHLIPQKAIKITPNESINTFQITDENGTVFTFDQIDQSYVTSTCPASLGAIENQFNSSWKLRKIRTTDGEEINFTYRTFQYQYMYSREFTKYIKDINQFGCPNKADKGCQKTIHHTEAVLEKISFSNGTVDFIYSDNTNYPIAGSNIRKDLPGNHALRKVIIKDFLGNEAKSFELQYDYFKAQNSSTNADDYRLKLIALEEINADKKHQFLYNESIKLPRRFSNSQDYWGYYNGQGSQPLYPTTFYGGQLLLGGDREVYPEYAKAGTLRRIVYPTGGYSEFEYESNQYFSSTGKNEYNIGSTLIAWANGSNYNSSQNFPFTILEKYEGIKLKVDNTCENTETVFDDACSFKVFNSNNEQVSFIREAGEYNFGLDPGSYTIRFEYLGDTCNCKATMSWVENEIVGANTNVLAGGLRIKKLKNYDGIKTEETQYAYTQENSTRSSGIIQGKPIFSYVITEPNPDATLGACTYLSIHYSSIYPIATASGNSVGYTTVTTSKHNNNENGKTVYTFTNDSDIINSGLQTPTPITSFDWKRGLLLSTTMYDHTNTKVYEEIKEYDFDYSFINNSSESYRFDSVISGLSIIGGRIPGSPPNGPNTQFSWSTYHITSSWVKPITTTKNYFSPANYTQRDRYYYDNINHLQLTRVETEGSDNNKVVQKTIYPLDITNPTQAEQKLIDQHRLTEPIRVETTKGSSKTVIQTLYNDNKWPGLVLPEYIQSKKNNNVPENRIVYYKYDDKGNPLEVSQANGAHIIYIWGYNDTYPIAKIENTTYTDMPTAIVDLINQIKTASTTENSEAAETSIRELFDQLREHPYFKAAQVASYTYDPLIGITSITDPKGYLMTYHYDAFNRLEFIKNAEGNLVSENKYNYKN
ncbi:RHS repeat protein [Aquimarina megaterium]|uniref:RHS repeat protein n=1 Tax=Aquimarina megaterium TaxID=1443666 RepID=UPI0009455B35|nr:RHS repeat protein [Aquimarina megaterium]